MDRCHMVSRRCFRGQGCLVAEGWSCWAPDSSLGQGRLVCLCLLKQRRVPGWTSLKAGIVADVQLPKTLQQVLIGHFCISSTADKAAAFVSS